MSVMIMEVTKLLDRVQGSPSQLRQASSGTVQTEHTLLILEISQTTQWFLAYR